MALHVKSVCPLLQVFDMPTSVAFYRDALGFEVVDSAPDGEPWDWVWLRLGGANVMLNTAYEASHRPPNPDKTRIAAHADTGLYFECPDVDGAYAHLRANNVDVETPAVAPYGMKQLYVKDPDGYYLCFQWPAS